MPEKQINIQDYLIRPDMEVNRDDVIVCFKSDYKWSDVMSLGNISTITGKAKGRKTFFVTLLVACILHNKNFRIKSNFKGDIILFDTEQGKYHVWLVAKRIRDLLGYYPDNVKIYGLRPLSVTERINIIENNIYQTNPKLVFIDGIRDLVTDINDAVQATEVVGKLMKWSYDLNCHICSILHQNKVDDNARGHIGTEIVNKSETVIEVNKANNSEFSIVKNKFSRGHDFKEFQFKVNNNLPEIDETEIVSYYDKDDENPF